MSEQSFGKYELVRKLATGGMAEVWLAQHTGIEGFERQLVIKRILPHLAEDQDFVRMFLNEAKISAKFSHPNIAQIFDLGQIDGNYYIAMEYIHGEDLGRVMRKAWSSGQWVSRPLAIRIIASACEGLAYAHAKVDEKGRPLHVVHRDISPQNLLISFDGAVKLVDFGIAKAADATAMTKSGAIKGKFAYMSPEQASGKPLDQRSDIFAIGLVLYELLTGVRPLKRDTELGTLQAALACAIERPSQVADVPEELDGVVMRALARSPGDRYDDARQFQQSLEEFLVTQRWVVGSVQIAELMRTLFADRLQKEASGELLRSSSNTENPRASSESLPAVLPSRTVSPGGGSRSVGPMVSPGGRHPSEISWDAPPGTSKPDLAPVAAEGDSGSRPAAAQDSGTYNARSPSSDSMMPPPPPPRTRARTPLVEDDVVEEVEEPSSGRGELNPSFGAWSRRYGAGAPPTVERPEPSASSSYASYDSSEGGRREERPSRIGGISREWARRVLAVALLLVLASGLRATWDAVLKPIAGRIWELVHEGKGGPVGGQPIYITAMSNLPGHVVVIHAEKGAAENETLLGDLPLTHAPGAHLGDTILIENKQRGARYMKTIQFGQPGEELIINKEFKTGSVLVPLKYAPPRPEGFRGPGPWIAFYNGDTLVGEYETNLNLTFELVEGEYDLEIRGAAMRQPVRFHVRVNPDGRSNVKPIDIRPYLFKSEIRPAGARAAQ